MGLLPQAFVPTDTHQATLWYAGHSVSPALFETSSELANILPCNCPPEANTLAHSGSQPSNAACCKHACDSLCAPEGTGIRSLMDRTVSGSRSANAATLGRATTVSVVVLGEPTPCCYNQLFLHCTQYSIAVAEQSVTVMRTAMHTCSPASVRSCVLSAICHEHKANL